MQQQPQLSAGIMPVEMDTRMSTRPYTDDGGGGGTVQMVMERKSDRANYTQLPNILFDKAYEGLSNLERWLTATILRIGWNWKPNTFYQISLRDISDASGISPGYLCPCNGKIKREGMLYKLQRIGLILIKKAIGKNAPYFLAITEKLWKDNSVYWINTKKYEQEKQSVYSVDTSVYPVNTNDYLVNTSVYSVDTQEATKPLVESNDSPPNTSNTNKIYKTDSSLTLVSDSRDAIADKHQRGYLDQTQQLAILEGLMAETNARFPDIAPSLPLTPAQEAQLYTSPVEMVCISDTSSHIAVPISKEAAPPQEQPHVLQVGATSPPARETRKRGVVKNGLSLQGQHILDEYQKFKGRKSTPGKATIEAANALVGLVASDEEFTSVLTEMRDNEFLNKQNVARDLDFVYRKYERYRDIVEQKQTKKSQDGVRLIGGKPSSELTDLEIEALPTPFLRKAARQSRASC